MISDVLFEAVQEINYYLNEPTFAKAYNGDLRARIVKLRDEMDAMRTELDTPSHINLSQGSSPEETTR